MINIIVVTHGEFGSYLVEAAESIVGIQAEGVRCISISPRLSMEELQKRLAAVIAELSCKEGIIITLDMPGGTPCNLAMPLAKDSDKVSVVSGVNLYMLVTAFNYRTNASLEDLTERMIATGKKSILDIKSFFLAKA